MIKESFGFEYIFKNMSNYDKHVKAQAFRMKFLDDFLKKITND